MGRWIGERLESDGRAGALPAAGGRRLGARRAGPARSTIPTADAALFRALEQTVRQTAIAPAHSRASATSTIRAFAAAVVAAFRALHGAAGARRRAAR